MIVQTSDHHVFVREKICAVSYITPTDSDYRRFKYTVTTDGGDVVVLLLLTLPQDMCSPVSSSTMVERQSLANQVWEIEVDLLLGR